MKTVCANTTKVRNAVDAVRSFVKTMTLPQLPVVYETVIQHVEVVADRIDELEAKVKRQDAAHATLIKVTTELIWAMRRRSVPVDPLNPDHDLFFQDVVDALTGLKS